jgi:hypothetical protein
MEIEKTPLYMEMLDVMANCDRKSQVAWKAMIHLDDQGNTYETLNVASVNLRRDYVQSFGDEMSCVISIPLGKYAKRIYPNRNHLQITLMRIPLLENSTRMDIDAEMGTERYSAVLIEEGPAITQMQGTETNDEEALDLVDILDVKFQLFNKAVEQLRLTQVGGIYRKTDMGQLLLTVLTCAFGQLKVDDQRNLLGVDLVEPSHQEKKEQVVVPHGLLLTDFPGFLQKRFGVYSSGLGSYIQNKYWYIFPLFDTTRFQTTLRTLSIYILPKRKFSEIERTYRTTSSTVSIITTSDTDFRGDNDINYINSGNGIRFTSADTMMDGFQVTRDNKTTIARSRNNSEFSSSERDDGLNFAPVAHTRITSNPFVHYSELASRKGGILRLNWENSNPQVIEPGMVARIAYFDQGEIKEAYGVVLGATHMTVKVGDYNTLKHTSNSQLVLFTNLKSVTQ